MGGLIHIMSNFSLKEKSMKIGKSKSNPNEFQKDELYSIGVPEPLIVEYSPQLLTIGQFTVNL